MDDEKPLKRADLRKRAEEKAAELAAEGMELHPVTASGRNLAKKFWGKEWMKSLAACEVYGMRLAPGRTYLRYGCVLDVKAAPGRIDALVMGEHLYEVRVHAAPPDEEALARLRARCAGHIGSWIDLLKGNLSRSCWKSCAIRRAACSLRRKSGVFPVPARTGRICASMRPRSCTPSA
ncbi:hypothetical protein PVA48_05615 [Akkermansia sp. JRP_AM1]|uniref:hypothetical protein n=1 Tax=Akkermansia sp. JRP_AM1 TaxID=3414159 RepID=UPI003BFA6D39